MKKARWRWGAEYAESQRLANERFLKRLKTHRTQWRILSMEPFQLQLRVRDSWFDVVYNDNQQ
jgi:hypothetical protein